jgi:hypothetical protein
MMISHSTRFLSMKMWENIPNNIKLIYEDTTTKVRNSMSVHLVRRCMFGMFKYVLVRFDTFRYVFVRLVVYIDYVCTFSTLQYVSVRFTTSGYRVGLFDMKLSLVPRENGWYGTCVTKNAWHEAIFLISTYLLIFLRK